MNNEDDPYPECANCKTLEDCPCPDLGDEDQLSLPMIPDICPKPITVMNETVKKHRYTHKLMKEN